MRVDVDNSGPVKPEFHAASWWVKDWGPALHVLRQQLAAAAAVWPALNNYEIVVKKTK